jgi:hypothetical protein
MKLDFNDCIFRPKNPSFIQKCRWYLKSLYRRFFPAKPITVDFSEEDRDNPLRKRSRITRINVGLNDYSVERVDW